MLVALGEMRGGITDLTDASGAPVLSLAEQETLARIAAAGKETGLIRHLTPFLAQLCLPTTAADASCSSCRRVLVNSERLQWLVHPSVPAHPDLEQKPDLFVSWHPFVEYRHTDAEPLPAGEDDVYLHGLVPHYSLQQAGCAVGLFEAKRYEITDKDFGELCAYHQGIEEGTCWGMVFGATSFWLYKSFAGLPVSLVRSKWTWPGSAGAIRDHFAEVPEPPLLTLLRRVLIALGVSVCHLEGATSGRSYRRSFLGSGAVGYVFAVRDATTHVPRALKIVLTKSRTHLTGEFQRLQTAAASCSLVVVPPISDSLRFFDGLGGGFLLEHVGEPYRLDTKRACCIAFETLAELHRSNVIHGDARLANLIQVGGQPRWVDLNASIILNSLASAETCREDARTLADSVAGEDVTLPPAVEEALLAYSASDAGSVVALAVAVWGARSASGGTRSA